MACGGMAVRPPARCDDRRRLRVVRRRPRPYLAIVPSRLPLQLAGRLWAVLLMLTIAFHAAVPIGAPLVADSGSAFSASTVDVALSPVRRGEVRAVVQVPAPHPVVLVAPVVTIAVEGSNIPMAHAWPDQTGPPPLLPLSTRPAPTGPPLA